MARIEAPLDAYEDVTELSITPKSVRNRQWIALLEMIQRAALVGQHVGTRRCIGDTTSHNRRILPSAERQTEPLHDANVPHREQAACSVR
jgi:hypothetical protein